MKSITLHLTVLFLSVALVLTPFSPPAVAQNNDETLLSSHSANATATAIQGTVTDSYGNPIVGIDVRVGDYTSMISCGSTTTMAQTDASGNYTLNVSAGDYLVFVNSHYYTEGYLPEAYPDVNSWDKISNATSVHVNTGQVVSGIDFDLPTGYKVTGRLVDNASQPVSGAAWHLEDPVQEKEYACALGGGTSLDGTFQFNIAAGLYDLRFCTTTQCYIVIKGKIIREATSLNDVLFSEASNPSTDYNPLAVLPGYNIESVVPGALNCPSDVTVDVITGKVYVAAVRSRHIYEVSSDGSRSNLANLMVYSLQAGPDGNLYGYFPPGMPKGEVYKITPAGVISTVGTLPQTSCESTLAVAPNLDLWIGYNGCYGTTMTDHYLYRMTQAGTVYTMATLTEYIDALDFDSNGNLYMTAASSKLYQINTSTGAQALLKTIQEPAAHHGLVASQEGDIFISTSWNDGAHPVDRVYKVTSSGVVSVLAEVPAGILQGLDQKPDGDLIGTMRGTGALYLIHLDGTWEIVLPGNGMSTPDALAFNPIGELLVNNDESAALKKINYDHGEYFARVNSFLPPRAAMAFLPSGDLYFSEAAPGLKPRLALISPSADVITVTAVLSFPAGLAFDPTGQLYVVENMVGAISKVSPDGMVTPFTSGLTRPQPLAADNFGNLYVGDYSGILQDPSNPAENPDMDQIWKVAPSGTMTFYLDHEVGMIAVSPSNALYITGPVGDYYHGVLRVNSDGSLTPIAVGFLDPVGLAFDVAGDLYITDNMNNSIIRITGFIKAFVTGHITSFVNGTPIPNAVISLVTDYPLIKGTRVTVDENGYYNIPVEARQYTLTVSAPGYYPTVTTLMVMEGSTITIDVELLPSYTVWLPVVARR